MQEHGIKAKGKRKFVVANDSKHDVPSASNLLQCNCTGDAPNQVWTGDIIYITTDEGWLYLAVVLDLFSRWSVQTHIQSALVTDALRMAWFRPAPEPGMVLRRPVECAQYCGHKFSRRSRVTR